MNPDPPKPTLEETVAMLEATLESTHDGILVVSVDRRVIRFNRHFAEMFSFPADVLERRDVKEMMAFVADQLEDADAVLFKSDDLWTNWSPEYLSRLRFKDGRVFERYVVAPKPGGPTRIGRVISYRDLSASIRIDQALEQHRAFLEKAQEVAHIGSWVAELDGSDRLGWSIETHRIFGVAAGDFAGTSETFFTFVHADDREAVRAAAAAAAAGEKPYDIEHRIVTASGAVRWVHERADILRDAQGRALRMIGTVQDITERRQLEEQLRHAQKLDALGRLAGGVAHDLNNALTAIAGYTELALIALRPEHPARADVQEIRRAAERAASVSRQLLAFSRKQLLEPRLFDLNDVIRNLAGMLQRVLGDVQIETALENGLPRIHADPGQIEQAIINMAVNARDAMPNGGRLVIATSSVHDVAVVHDGAGAAPASVPPGPYVMLRVADTGHGMTAETRAQIFEPFFTTKPAGKGTGLGLAMVWGTVKQSGGYIFVESEPGQGTTFRLYFRAAGAAAAAPQKPAPARRRTVLVVEDDPAVRALVTSTLTRGGYTVLQASSFDEAVAVAAETDRVDLLLTDATMPGRSGLDLARLLLSDRPGLPVIVMTGYAETTLNMTDLSGDVSVMRKPFSPSELRQRIRETLDRAVPPIPLTE